MDPATKDYEDLPRFSDGRIDYTHSSSAPIVSCVVEYSGKILLIKRSYMVSHYKNKWDVITGYIDNPNLSIVGHAILELKEELGITEDKIAEIKMKRMYRYPDVGLNKTWRIYPVLIRLKEMADIVLNHENAASEWIYPKDVNNYDVIPDLEQGLKNALS